MVSCNSDSSSDSDDEDLARLREAVDFDTLKDNMYSKENKGAGEEEANQKTSVENVAVDSVENVAVDSKSLELPYDPKSLANYIKATIQANVNKSKLKPSGLASNALSLRRDRQDDAKSVIISDLEVTPQFQRFVGTKLGDFLDKNIENTNDILKDKEEKCPNDESEIKLLKRCKVGLKEEIENCTKRSRPELLTHRNVIPSPEDLSACAVSGEFVLSQVEVEPWVNKFAGRVEEGIERIKKKKKKVKKKRKDLTADTITISNEKCH